MQITFSPQRSDKTLTISKQGDVLTINGTLFDFSVIPDGATLPADAVACEFIVDKVERTNNDLHITMLLPHSAEASHAALFPSPLINPADGLLELPQ